MLERHLRDDLPAESPKEHGDAGAQGGVALIEKLVGESPAPADVDAAAHLDGAENLADRPERQLVDVASLQPRDGRLGDTGPRRHVLLSPAPSATQRSYEKPDPSILHDRQDGSAGFAGS